MTGYSANRQITRDDVIVVADYLYLIPLKGYDRILIYIQKITTSQVSITVQLSSPEASSVNSNGNRRILQVHGIEFESAVYIFEMSTDVSDHHVPRAKFSRRVSRLECPFCHCRFPVSRTVFVLRIYRVSLLSDRFQK